MTDCETTIWMAQHSQARPEHVPVLVLCPDRAGRDALAKFLCPPSFRMLVAESAGEAAALLRRTQVPVVIAGCPELAREALQSLRSRPGPRLLLAAGAQADTAELEAFDVIASPIDRDELLWAVTDAWMDWRRERELLDASPRRAGSRGGGDPVRFARPASPGPRSEPTRVKAARPGIV